VAGSLRSQSEPEYGYLLLVVNIQNTKNLEYNRQSGRSKRELRNT
jgi:hypothetical protein